MNQPINFLKVPLLFLAVAVTLFSFGQNVSAASTPIGTFDEVVSSLCRVAGWTKDPDSTSSTKIHIYKDGRYGLGGTFVTSVLADKLRSDLPYTDKNHGFVYDFVSASGLYDGKDHALYIYGIDVTGDGNVLLAGNPKTIRCAAPITATSTFVVNDLIQINAGGAYVRAAAGGAIIGSQSQGALGTLVYGPVYSGGYNWWEVNYNIGTDGWSAETSFIKYTALLPLPTSTVFSIGDRTQVTASLTNVRSTPGGTIIGEQSRGSLGTVIEGPVTVADYIWWKINYDIGVDGWSAGNLLGKAPIVIIEVPLNDSQFISQSVPASMTAGQTYPVSVTMKNTGTANWTLAGNYKLGSQNPQDNKTWGMSRVTLSSGETIAPNQSKTFAFNVTAPATSGTYNFNWRMVQEGVGWFGGLTTNIAVNVVTAPTPSPTHTIGVRSVNGNGEFYNKITGEKFIPRGNHYARLIPSAHALFDVGVYNASAVETALNSMQNNGYNTVGVILSYAKIGGSLTKPGVDTAYMANVIDFLRRAKAHNLYVMLRAQWLPSNYNSISASMPTPANVDGTNLYFMKQGRIDAYKQFWTDVINSIKGTDSALLSTISFYDAFVEPHFSSDWKPFSLTSGFVTPAEGGTYDMSNNASRQRAADNSALYWANQISAAIKAADPSALVGAGVFSPGAVGRSGYDGVVNNSDNRAPFRLTTLSRSSFDYADLHGKESDYDSAEVSLLSSSKPLLMGEIHAPVSWYSDPTVAAAGTRDQQATSCSYGFDGWIMWTWDTDEQSNFWNALSGGGAINSALSPFKRQNPCNTAATVNNAAFISQSVPTSLLSGESRQVSITLKNTGTGNWMNSLGYRLGSENPANNLTWGTGRVTLNDGEVIRSGEQRQFTFTIKAPQTAGTYNFQWKMLQERYQWFGVVTPNVAITVRASSAPPPVPTVSFSASPTSITSGQSSTLTWSGTNATSCTASGGWTGTKSLSGSEVVSPASNTTYTLTCTGAGGSISDSATISVSAPADTTSPAVSLSSPATGTTYTSAQTVSINATASDNVGVTKVEFYDGATLKGTDTSSPYSYSWAFTSTDNGTHSFTAKVYDAAGNTTVSSVVSLTVSITSVTPPSTSTKFSLNDRVKVSASATYVRSTPGGSALGLQYQGALGTVISGPVSAGGYTWWNINYDTGVDGWSAEHLLTKTSSTVMDLKEYLPILNEAITRRVSTYPSKPGIGVKWVNNVTNKNGDMWFRNQFSKWPGNNYYDVLYWSGTDNKLHYYSTNSNCDAAGNNCQNVTTYYDTVVLAPRFYTLGTTVTGSGRTRTNCSGGYNDYTWKVEPYKGELDFNPRIRKDLPIVHTSNHETAVCPNGPNFEYEAHAFWGTACVDTACTKTQKTILNSQGGNVPWSSTGTGQWSETYYNMSYPLDKTTPTSTYWGFAPYDRIQIKASGANVRTGPGGTVIGAQPAGALGTLKPSPVFTGGYIWWPVNYDNGADGWSAESTFARPSMSDPKATAVVTFQPKEISGIIKNPGIGYQTFHTSAATDKQLPSAVEYKRFNWGQIEPSPGVFDFSAIDTELLEAKKAGQKLAFRIMPFGQSWVGTEDPYYKGPLGLKNAGFPGFDFSFFGAPGYWIPNLDSPIVQADLAKLIAAMGVRYGNNPDIDHIDVGFIGDWGEFHYSFTKPEVLYPKDTTLQWFFDTYKKAGFKVPLIVGGDLLTVAAKEGAWDYAMQKGFGWREDCWGDWGDMVPATGEIPAVRYDRMGIQYQIALDRSPDAWKTAPVVMEPCGTMKSWGPSWTKTLQWTIDNHISEFSNKSDVIPSSMIAPVQDMLTKIGYRFVFTQAQYPSQVSAGQNFNLTLNWTNKGNAPMYFDRNLVVKIGSKVIDTGKSFKGFLPGSRTDNVSINTTGITPGTYPLQIGLAEPGKSPDITLAIEGSGPWYQIGNITIKSNSNAIASLLESLKEELKVLMEKLKSATE